MTNVLTLLMTLHFLQGYWGCAVGKAKQAAKTEIEKLQVKFHKSFDLPRNWLMS